MHLEIKDHVTRPRSEWGTDWGAVRHVLARAGHREVWWRPGHKYWGDRMSPSLYAPTRLSLVDMSVAYPHDELVLKEGGRLTFSVINKYGVDIDEWLGLPVDLIGYGRIDPKLRTTVEVVI